MRPLERRLISAPVHSQSWLFFATLRLRQVCWFKSRTLRRVACLRIVTCAQIIGPVPSRWISHSAVAIWWADIALVILICILWNGKYEQVVNASGKKADMMFTKAAWMEKRFQQHWDHLESLFWERLFVCDHLLLHLKCTQTFSLRSVMGWTFRAPVVGGTPTRCS